MRKLSLVLIMVGLFLSQSVTPVAAMTNPLPKITSSLKQQVNRLYLQYLPGDKPGALVLQQSLVSLENVKTVRIKAEVSGRAETDQGSDLGNGKMTLAGPIQFQQPGDWFKSQLDFSLEGEVTTAGTSLQAGADLKQIDQNLYFKINALPVLPFFDATLLKGQWLKMPAAEVEKNNRAEIATEAETRQLMQAGEQLLKEAQIGQAQRENQSGRSVYVVEVIVPDEAVIKYLNTMTKLATAQTLQPEIKPKQELTQTLQSLDEIKAVVWIDQKTFYPIHLELPLAADLTKMAVANPLDAAVKPGRISGQLTVDFSEFNQPVTVTVPSDARDFQQAIMETVTLPNSDSEAPAETNPAGKTRKTKPVELQELTPSEKAMLKKYGVEVEDIIP